MLQCVCCPEMLRAKIVFEGADFGHGQPARETVRDRHVQRPHSLQNAALLHPADVFQCAAASFQRGGYCGGGTLGGGQFPGCSGLQHRAHRSSDQPVCRSGSRCQYAGRKVLRSPRPGGAPQDSPYLHAAEPHQRSDLDGSGRGGSQNHSHLDADSRQCAGSGHTVSAHLFPGHDRHHGL